MNRRLHSWKLFSVRGVDINIHVSLLFLLLYVAMISTAQFANVAYTSGVDVLLVRGSPYFWAVLFSLSLIASILIHELGHAFLAQAYGAKVRRIVLLMLGGMSEIEELNATPSREWKIAIVGPLVSMAIGILLFSLREVTQIREVRLYAYWVGSLNIMLGIFNLLPAFPMDGGRILRSLLVARRGKAKGTRAAVSVSRVFAILFGLLGLFQFNFILILIAFFLYSAAQGELLLVTGETNLKGLKVNEIMNAVPVLRAEQSLADAARAMSESNCSVLPVEGTGNSFGILSVEALRRVPRDLWVSTAVDSIEDRVTKVLNGNDTVDTILEHGLSSEAIPVVENGHVTGLLRSSKLIELIRLKEALG